MGNDRSYAEKICYNISMIDLTEKRKIEEFKTEITKTVPQRTNSSLKEKIPMISSFSRGKKKQKTVL